MERGGLIEFFLLSGAVAVSALTLNFGPLAAEWVRPFVLGDPRADAIIFAVVFLNLVLVTRILLRRLSPLLGVGQGHWLVHAGGLVLGGSRGVWWCGIILVALTSTGVSYLQTSVTERSLIGSRMAGPARKHVTQVVSYFPGSQYRRTDLIPPVVVK